MVLGHLPKSVSSLSDDSNWAHLKDAFPAPQELNKNIPQIFYSKTTAVLILFKGNPVYNNIEGTSLKYTTNTESDVFFSDETNSYYYLASGRWFSASSPEGPWTFASDNLPKDFLNIPTTSPASSILAHLPGTDEAADAIMIAEIPTKIQVNGADAAKKVDIKYSGEPQFKAIDSTNLEYAVNTTDKVIEVSDESYYACEDGFWFDGTTAEGPWQAASTVPQAIYDMPASSPVYNVTYVTQTVSNGMVNSSYTSGYEGVYVAGVGAAAVVMYGSGYYYPPYYYYPPIGYPLAFGMAMTYGCYAYHPYYYGGSAGTRQFANPNGTAGAIRVTSGDGRTAYTGHVTSNSGATIAGKVGLGGSAKIGQSADGDMYASRNGNVYKKSGSGWQGYNGNGNWSNADKNAGNNQFNHANNGANTFENNRGSSSEMGNMNNEFQNRQRGATQASQFSGRSSAGRSFGGGGGFSGGFGSGGFGGRR